MSSPVKRSQQFMYFQSKAKHYDNIRKIQPAIHSFRQQHQSPRPRPRSLLKQYDQQRTNQYLVNTILSIRHKSKSRIQVLGNYSRYNNFNQNSHKISKYGTFRQAQRYRSIEQQNFMLGLKILEMKPSIGTVNDWNQQFVNVKSRKKIASKLDQKKSMSIYARNQFVPEYYQTFMDRDGSTVAIKDKLFQVPKFIAETYIDPKKTQKKQIKLDLDFQKIIKDTSGQLNNIN